MTRRGSFSAKGWHFFPAYAFKSHFGISFSQNYLYNRPVEKTFGMNAKHLFSLLDMKMPRKDKKDKWRVVFTWGKTPTPTDILEAFGLWVKKELKKYVNHLFLRLG